MESEKLKRPVFLVCSERSGSNLIRSIFNAHPDFSAPPPFHLFQYVFKYNDEYMRLNRSKSSELMKNHSLELINHGVARLPNEISPGMVFTEGDNNMVFLDVFDRIYNHITQSKRLFYKENHSYEFVPALLDRYSDAKFVIQVRDPRDFILSMVKRSYEINDIFRALEIWKKDQERAKELLKYAPDRTFLIKYEDLIEDSKKSITELCDFLKCSFNEKMLNFHSQNHSKITAQQSKSWENLNKPIISSNSKKYLAGLSKLEIKCIESELASLMKFYQYPLEMDSSSSFYVRLISRIGSTPLRKFVKGFLPSHIKTEPLPKEMDVRQHLKSIRAKQSKERQSS